MVMINQLLVTLRNRLEELLQLRRPRTEPWVALTNPVELDGTPSQDSANKIIMCIASIQQDASTSSFRPPRLGGADTYYDLTPPLHLDLHILIIASFTGANYPAGLEMLSRVISFFQQTPVITHDLAPDLPAEMDKLVIEYVSLDFAQANNVLMLTGLKCLPFVLYRIRRVPFAAPAIHSVAGPARQASATVAADG